MKPIKWTHDRYAILKEMLQRGASTDEMAQALGTTDDAIYGATYRLKKRLGTAGPGRWPAKTVEQKIIDRFKDGRAVDSIANVVGMKRADVSKILTDNGFSVDVEPVAHAVHPMWGMDDATRREWIAKRARKAAQKALKAMGAA